MSGTASGSSLPAILTWGIPALAVVAVIVLVAFQSGGGAANTAPAMPLGTAGAIPAPDISSMSPVDRADRLFNRVMRLASEGHADSAAFFAPMAIGAFEALAPLNAHQRYDLGLIAVVSGDFALATAQADSILKERSNHLLGLTLAARAAEARGDKAAAAAFRKRLVASEASERKAGLLEYTDHDADIKAAIDSARGK